MKSWLQLNGLWHLVSGSDKKPAGKPEVLDSKGHVVSPAVPTDEDKLDRWEIKAERAAGALKTAMSHELRVLIRDCVKMTLFRSGTHSRPPLFNRGLPLASMPTTASFPSRRMTLSLWSPLSTR